MKYDMERMVELEKLYLRNMQKIKWRTRAIYEVLQKKRATTFISTNIEFCVLQIRKILELIALSSLISDADIYKEKMQNVEKMWNAKYILQDLERINPQFYPQPIKIIKQEGKEDSWETLDEPYLTKEKFILLYDKCGRFMHESSPFLSEAEINIFYTEMERNFKEWMLLIRNLLNFHTVHLYNRKDMFAIMMNEGNKPPTGTIFRMYEE